ncbi:ATP-binding protein [Actinoplanes sp. CA-252034]|uniref:ATP-binding protein n=1 Tax=Actinoplanes sp. CA-252034 TaxID=3239906 RepID=UPI003D97A423
MNLRLTHYGYAYQDLITGIALVDLVLGVADQVTVDTKGEPGDRFDDLTVRYRTGRRVRVQIKHTTTDRKLSKQTFSADGRSLRLDRLFASLLADLERHPGTEYRVVVRDGGPDEGLAAVLEPVTRANDPGDPVPGLPTRRFAFNPEKLQQMEPWKQRLNGLTAVKIQAACASLTIDTAAPAATLDFSAPGPAERVLLRRVVEELGAGRVPNTAVQPEYVALALTHAATGARARDGEVTRESLVPRVGLTTDFGAVAEGHPIEANVVVPRTGAVAEVREHVGATALVGGRVVITGEPGVGKSWLCQELADAYRADDWIVARHHCWLGAADIDRDERVLADVVIGSLIKQLEQVVPEATAGLRPRFAATAEALTEAVRRCRVSDPERSLLLIVDGLDHVDRVLGRNTGQRDGPSRLLAERLLAIELPDGVCMIIASQPSRHLAGSGSARGRLVQMPRMSWDEVCALAAKHGLFSGLAGITPSADEKRAVVDLLFERSSGNALYATYLCRYAIGTSPLDEGTAPGTVNQIVHRLKRIPGTATDIDAYYGHLLGALTPDQLFTIGTLAVCDFALSADELGDLVDPMIRPLVAGALATLAPVLNSQPGLGGLRIHHESFSRHILRDKDDGWVATVRLKIAEWLMARGFYIDARAFRHLPELLARLDRYQDLKRLIEAGFVAEAISAFQPPEALHRVVAVVARESEVRLDWPTLITCVEVRKAIDAYETESLPDTLVSYADVVVDLVGPDTVADRLLYEGRPTFAPQWGLRLCHAVDLAGAAAPWKVYLDAHTRESSRGRRTDSSDHDGSLHLAVQLGLLRLRIQRGDTPPDLAEQVAEYLGRDHDVPLDELAKVFAAGLPPATMPDVAAAITDPAKAARVYLTLANLAAGGTPGLPEPAELASQAWTLAPALDIAGYLSHSVAAADVLGRSGVSDLGAELLRATATIVGDHAGSHGHVQRWLSLLELGHAVDRAVPMRCAALLGGVGFYRAWLRYAVATIGTARDVGAGLTTAEDASTAVRVALADLAEEAHAFTGEPRACDLHSIQPLIHQVLEASLAVVRPSDLDQVLSHLIAIGDGTTTTTNLGLPENGPLITNDLLGILARLSDRLGVASVHALMRVVRQRRDDSRTQYRITADFELATARICIAAGAGQEADECWRRASLLLAAYGGHKDPTIYEVLDSIQDVADVADIHVARRCLHNLVDPVYLVSQHTNGRGTSNVVSQWWENVATIDPIAAGLDGADVLIADVGFEDNRAYTAHTTLLTGQITTADPIVLAALRLTTGTGWRDPAVDRELLTRLAGELASSPQTDVLLAIVANSIAATYDDEAAVYSDSQPAAVATPELVRAVVRLGGTAFLARTPLPKKQGNSRRDARPTPDRLELPSRIAAGQSPSLPTGRSGAVLAARAFAGQRLRDGIDTSWDLESVTNIIGWRVLEETLAHGAAAGIGLLDDIAREIPSHADNEMFAVLGQGLALRCDTSGEPLKTVASYCLTLAYTRIRGGGGWRTFAGRRRTDLWATAHHLDGPTAERTLAAAIAAAVASTTQHNFGVTQAVVAAFAVTAPATTGQIAVECWEAALSVIARRLPGAAERGAHTYRPTVEPDGEAVDEALAALALATIVQPLRADLRQSLLAAALLLTCRPKCAQTVLARIFRRGLDAGRTTWLLEVISACLPGGELTEELAAELAILARTDWLSVRSLAAAISQRHGRVVPDPPATEPAPQLRVAFRELLGERE